MAKRNMKVLLVDDDPIFLDFLENELGELGDYDVTRAESATQALDVVLAAKDAFDCFLLDIDMPRVSGIELCEMLRGQPSTSGKPIIMVTRLREVEMMDKAFAAGATDYINKPLVPSELKGRMQMAQAKKAEEEARVSMMRAVLTDAPMKISDAPVPDGVPSCVDHLAMENYAFRIGSEELCRRTILGVQITNVEEIFENNDPLSFKVMLNDVAELITEAFSSQNLMVSYAGNGQFLIMIGERVEINLERNARRMRDLMGIYQGRAFPIGGLQPRIRIGMPVSPTLFSCASPDEILVIAMGLAKEKGTDLVGSRWPSLMHFREGELYHFHQQYLN